MVTGHFAVDIEGRQIGSSAVHMGLGRRLCTLDGPVVSREPAGPKSNTRLEAAHSNATSHRRPGAATRPHFRPHLTRRDWRLALKGALRQFCLKSHEEPHGGLENERIMGRTHAPAG